MRKKIFYYRQKLCFDLFSYISTIKENTLYCILCAHFMFENLDYSVFSLDQTYFVIIVCTCMYYVFVYVCYCYPINRAPLRQVHVIVAWVPRNSNFWSFRSSQFFSIAHIFVNITIFIFTLGSFTSTLYISISPA